jgi:hypothetical protein
MTIWPSYPMVVAKLTPREAQSFNRQKLPFRVLPICSLVCGPAPSISLSTWYDAIFCSNHPHTLSHKGRGSSPPLPRWGILLNRFNGFCPTGKSLLIFRNRVKPRNQKYFASPLTQIRCISKPSWPDRGAFRDRHGRWAGDAVDAAASGEQ